VRVVVPFTGASDAEAWNDLGATGPKVGAARTMYVVVPYARNPLAQEVIDALEATGVNCHPVDLSGSDRAYFDLLSSLWVVGETFCLVEHDIVIHPTALDELSTCPNDWCAFPYPYGGPKLAYGMGCVKFSADLIARNPDAMLRVAVLSDEKHPARHWCRLDAWLQGCVLPSNGEQRCEHETPVKHLERGCAHRCW
jgi:hypothetical protein